MKADQGLLGTRAERRVDFYFPNGEKTPVAIRPITQLEEADAIAFALEFAKGRGVVEPEHGSVLFDIAVRAKVVATATLDVDSPAGKREPFFPSAEFVIEKYHSDAIIYLHQAWKIWQDECSPLVRVHNESELFEAMRGVAKDDDDHVFFSRLSPRTQAICARFSANLALSSQLGKSFDSSTTDTPPSAGASED